MTEPDAEQLVIDALNPWDHFTASDGIRGTRVVPADDLIRRLGIDESMTVVELRETLAVGAWFRKYAPQTWALVVAEGNV
jgi:hypothetical protein